MKNALINHSAGTCIICGGRLSIARDNIFDTRFGIASTFSIVRCAHCGVEQTEPVPTPVELKLLYETYYNFGGERGTRYTRLREQFLFSPFYRFFLALDGDISFQVRKGSGNLLDIGCNEGRGLKFYCNNGFHAEGLELNEEAAAVARSQGFIVHTELLDKHQPREGYDIAVLSNVLEHSPDPKSMLFHARRVLNPGGQLWISCPNSRSWLRGLFGRFWINWHVPFHILHFSADGLKKLLNDSGFELIETRHETPSLWVAHTVIARLFASPGKPTKALRNPFLVVALMLFIRGLLFPLLWAGNRLGRGDCLVVTARKR